MTNAKKRKQIWKKNQNLQNDGAWLLELLWPCCEYSVDIPLHPALKNKLKKCRSVEKTSKWLTVEALYLDLEDLKQ